MIDDLVILKSMMPGVALAISRLSTGLAEESKLYCLNQIHFIYEKIRDMHILSLILCNRPHLSLLDEGTVGNIRTETRKLIGNTIPNLISEIATAKKEAKTYQNIAKYFTMMGQSISNLDLYLVGYSGDEIE